MRILSRVFFASVVLAGSTGFFACSSSDSKDGSGGMGGDATGGKTGSGGKDTGTGGKDTGTGGKDTGTGGMGGGMGGMGGMPAGDEMFTVEDCLADDGPADAVKAFTVAGAFAGSSDWMDGWTNWSTDTTPEDDDSAPDTEVSKDISKNTTWSKSKIYSLTAPVHVLEGATLTIEAGTLIKSNTDGSLVITRGGKINAVGTADAPIVFTSTAKNGKKAKGNWGGVILLGKAKNWDGDTTQIEGLVEDPINQHGGTDDKDSSGTLEYVRIEFGGTEIGAGNEINGLTLGSVGSGTKISHVEVNTSLDDCYEWFGGTVNVDHLVCNDSGDDMFDGDKGYRGTISDSFGRQIAPLSDDPNGFEMDGDNEADHTVAVNSKITTKNVTVCGTGIEELNFRYGAVLRENLKGSHSSDVFIGFDVAFDTRDNVADLSITDSYAWDNIEGVGYDETFAKDSQDCMDQGWLCDDDNGFDEVAWFEDESSNTSN